MLRFLLDEHLSPAIRDLIGRERPEIEVECLRDWKGGTFRGQADPLVLAAAVEAGLTLVTFDQRTIRPLIVRWAIEGPMHHGVIFVDQRTFAPNDIAGIARGLIHLWDRFKDEDWRDRAAYLQPATRVF